MLALLGLTPLRASAAPTGDTGVVNMSTTTNLAEGEVPLAVDPLNPQNLAAVSNTWQADFPGGVPVGNGLMSIALYISHEGGRHWRTNRIQQGGLGTVPNPAAPVLGTSPEFSDLGNTITSDADVVWDRHGNLYVEAGCLHTLQANLDEVAHVWHSADGGDTFDGPYTAVSVIQSEHEELDRPWFAVDNSGGPRDGTLYMAFETGPFTDDPPKVFLKESTDHGRTWSPTVRVDDGTYETQFNPRNRPVVDAGGALDIVYDRAPVTNTPFNSQQAPIQLVLARSTDGGQTFTRTVLDDNVSRVQSPDEALASYSEMIPAIAADPTHPGRLAVAWPQALDAGNSRIVLRLTSDGGEHWTPRVDLADDPATIPDQHDHGSLRWLDDGRLAAGWRDRRNSGGTWTANFQEWARLFDVATTGLTPTGPALQLTDGPQLPEASFRGPTMPDEFQGLAGTSTSLMATWAQPAGSYTDVFFRGIPLAAFTRGGPGAPVAAGSAGLPGTGTAGIPGGLLLVPLAIAGIVGARVRPGRAAR